MTEMGLSSIRNRHKTRSLTNSRKALGERYPYLARGQDFDTPYQTERSPGYANLYSFIRHTLFVGILAGQIGGGMLMKKKLALILAVLIAITVLGACGDSKDSVSSGSAPASSASPSGTPGFEGTLTIGALAQVTGANAMNGLQVTQGMQLACDQINAQGGVQGLEVLLVVEDTANDTDMAINAANRLLANESVVAVVGPQQSAQVFAIQELIKKGNMPLICAGTNPGIPELDNENLFSGRANDLVMARIAAKYLASLGLKKIAVMTASEDFGLGGKEVAVEYFEEIGQDYVIETFNNDDSDFTGSIIRVKNAGADGIFIWCLNAPYVILARQLYEQGVDLPVCSNASGITSTVLALVEIEWLEGWCVVGDFVPSNPEPKIQEFNRVFMEKYDMETDLISGCYYDMANALIYAMQNLCDDPTDRAAVREALCKLDGQYTGLIGSYYCDETRQMMFETGIIQFQNSEIVFVEKVSLR